MPTVKVSRRFQVTIPQAIRRQLDIDAGDDLEAIPTSEGILYKPKPKKRANREHEITAYWENRINNEAGVEITEKAREKLEVTLAQPSIGPFSSVEEMLTDMEGRRKEGRSDGTKL